MELEHKGRCLVIKNWNMTIIYEHVRSVGENINGQCFFIIIIPYHCFSTDMPPHFELKCVSTHLAENVAIAERFCSATFGLCHLIGLFCCFFVNALEPIGKYMYHLL
jgi:hypothetical protein